MYRFEVTNAKDMYHSNNRVHIPDCLFNAASDLSLNLISIVGKSPVVEINKEGLEANKIVAILNMKYGFKLKDVSEARLPISVEIRNEVSRLLTEGKL